MPKYRVFQESTGVTLDLEGDKAPDLDDINRAFAFYGQQKYPNAPVLQAPPSLYEQAKAVAPSLARVAAPLAFGRPMPEDIATTGRVVQQGAEAVRRLTGGREKPEELLQGASQIEREGILALGSASPEKRELAASLGGRLGEVVSEYTPIPESVTRPVGQVAGQVSADLLSPMNLMSLGIAGAARQASRIPQLVAGAEFAETTTPSAVRAAQIADLRRASGSGSFPEALQKELMEFPGGHRLKDSANAVEQVGRLVAPALLPPIALGAAESTGMALQTVVDPNATPEQKLKASLEAGVGMLFSAGLGAQVGKTFGMKRGVTQAQVLEQLASRKQTVGEAISKVEGLLNEMDQIVPVENLRDQFRRFTSEMNPDEPFIFRQEPVGEGPRSRSRFVTEEERAAVAQEQAFQESNQQAALEKAAEASGTPLKTAEQLFQERQEANKPPVIPSEEVPPAVRDYIAEAQARRDAAAAARGQFITSEAVDLLAKVDSGGVPAQITRNLERIANENGITVTRQDTPNTVIEKLRRKGSGYAREVGQPPVIQAAAPEGTPLRSTEEMLAERLRVRDERIAAEQEAARPETLRGAEEIQAQRSAERQAQRERAAAIRSALGRRELTVEELMREEADQPRPSARQIAEELRRQIEPRIEAPEVLTEPRRAREGGLLPQREAIVEKAVQEGTPLRRAEDIMAERLRARDERVAAEQQRIAAEQARVPLETASEKLARALQSRDRRLAAEAAAEALESGAARGESVRVTRATVEKLLRIKEKPAGQAVAEETIFNEVWNKALEETQGKSKRPEWNGTKQVPEMWKYNTEGERFGLDVEYKLSPVKKIPTSDIKSGEFDSPLTGDQVNDIAAILKSDPNQIPPIVVEINKSGQLVVVDGEHRFGAANAIGLKEIPVRVAIRSDLPTKQYAEKANQIAKKLEGLRVKVEPGVGANPFPQLMGAAWNGALSVAQAVIRAGGSVADGVAAGIRYAKQNFKGKFDEADFTAQLQRVIERPSAVQVPEGMAARRFAERAAASPGIPPKIREAIAASPEASYVRQNLKQTEQQAGVKTVDELYADISDPESNTSTASSVELIKRQIAAGEAQDVVDKTLKLAKRGTTMGQLINQMKLLKSGTREGIIYLVTKSMEENGRTPDGPQLKKLGDLMDVFRSTSDIAQNAELKWKEASNLGDNTAIDAAFNELQLADSAKNQADAELTKQISRMNPSLLPDLYVALVQGSVQSTLSLAGNLYGNIVNRPMSELSAMVAKLVDSSLFRGRLGNTYNPRARAFDRINSLRKSVPEAFQILKKGSEAAAYEPGFDMGNPLNFTRAARNVYDRIFNGANDIPLLRNAVEMTLGAYPDTIFRINQSVDNVFKSADRAALIREVGQRRGLTDAQIKVAQRNPKLYEISNREFEKGVKGFTADDLGYIDFEAARSVFQQENAATQFASMVNRFVKEKGGPVFYIPYRTLFLFQKTPINVAAEALSFMPSGLVRRWGQMAPREKNLAAVKLTIGAMLITAYNQLYDKGIITPNLDTPGETNKARELAKSGGVMPPGTLNVSGLVRYVNGEDPSFQPGDNVRDLAKFGTSGAIGMMVGTARRIRERSRTSDPDWLTIAGGTVLSAANFIQQQGFLDGVSGMIKALSQEGGASMESLVKKYLSTATSPVQPAILGSLMRAEREFVPVTGGEGVIKDLTNELNQKYAALPFFEGKQLPLRRDLWGDPVRQTPKSENPWVYNFLEPWKSREIDADPLNASIYRVWRRTADNRAIPSIPNPQITYGKTSFEKLSPEQFDRYAQLVGFYRRKLAEEVYMTNDYREGSDDARIALLNRAYDRGINIGKYRFLQELRKSGQTLTPVAPRRGFEE
jgi:hypothetical protein